VAEGTRLAFLLGIFRLAHPHGDSDEGCKSQ
jgi:hypothetical protein